MREPAAKTPTAEALQTQVTVSSLKTMAADPRTTNALLLVMVLCISGYMPDTFATLCGA